MLARCGKFLVIAALVCSTGLHWAALQTVAWTTMLAANLTTESFSESLSRTFDGDHPCPLCKAVRAGTSSGKKTATAAGKMKFECPPLAINFILVAPEIFEPFACENFSADSLSSQPPLPPPRCFFA